MHLYNYSIFIHSLIKGNIRVTIKYLTQISKITKILLNNKDSFFLQFLCKNSISLPFFNQ